MKLTFLFIATQTAVIFTLMATLHAVGIDYYLIENGLNVSTLLIFAGLTGFVGSLISLFTSKTVAKLATGTSVIDRARPKNPQETWLVDMVEQLSERAQINCPEIGIFEGAPNAFATGASRNSALVAVSTELMDKMTREEVMAVLGHEVAHIANGDMVTLTMIQGILNTFVIFFARIVGKLIDRLVFKNDRGVGAAYYITVVICEIMFGILASFIVAWFSRQREFRADRYSAKLLRSRRPMINALKRLDTLGAYTLPKSFQNLGISSPTHTITNLLASHPPIRARIEVLEKS